jgi:hypothetical protein
VGHVAGKNKAPESHKEPSAAAAALLTLGAIILFLNSCSAAGNSASVFASACQPFDPDVTHSCVISSERWSEIGETEQPPGMYRYCAWPGLLSGAYRTRYRDLEGRVHDFTEAPAQTPSFLLEAVKGVNDKPATEVIEYRMLPRAQSCPSAAPR